MRLGQEVSANWRCSLVKFQTYCELYLSDSAGRVQKDIYNKKGNPSYKYYYGSTPGSK